MTPAARIILMVPGTRVVQGLRASSVSKGEETSQMAKRAITPAVIIVGADKGGVGKTTVMRTLLDYFFAREVPIRAFDTEAPKGTLKRFYSDITEVVDVTRIPDQMKIFDTVSESAVTLVDVRSGMLSPTLTALRDTGFIEAARKGQFSLSIFHVVGPSISSLDEILETSNFTSDVRYFLVKNFINNTHFFEWDQATYNSYFKRIKGAVEITIPKLNEMACEQVELASVPFLTFIANRKDTGESASYSFVLRGYVRHWLGQVWSEYDRVKLVDVVSAKEEPQIKATPAKIELLETARRRDDKVASPINQ